MFSAAIRSQAHLPHRGMSLRCRPSERAQARRVRSARPPVLAVARGLILRGPYKFYKAKSGVWTYAIEVKHTKGYIVRYTEVGELAEGIKTGVSVEEGQTIAYVGAALMLHFELYKGTEHGPLTDRSRAGFQRRADLLDPTKFIDSLRQELYSQMATAQ